MAAIEVALEEAKARLRREIRLSKRAKWRELQEEVEGDRWGRPYRIVAKKLGRGLQNVEALVPGGTRTVVRALFPRKEVRELPGPWTTPPEERELFTTEEVVAAANALPGQKAVGPGGNPNEAVKAIIGDDPEKFRTLLNKCLREGVVPATYKKARLVLIPKKGKSGRDPKGYRPLCLIDGEAKILERLVADRTRDAIERDGGLSPRQFGFRKGKSTVDALKELRRMVDEANGGPRRGRKHCLAVALDASNAFNSVPWWSILEALERRRVPEYLLRMLRSYLEERTVEYRGEGGRIQSEDMTGGIPQGSVLGPLLWNVVFDDVFRIPLPQGVELVGFADDILIVARERGIQDTIARAQEATSKVAEWMATIGVEVASQKTAAAWLARRRAGRVKGGTINLLGSEVLIECQIKYLGVIVGTNPLHTLQVQEAAAGAARATKAVGRLLANVGGPREEARRLLIGVGLSKLLYAAPAWAEATKSKRNTDRLRGAMRAGNLRVTRGYKTISTEAAEVLASSPPADLLVIARSKVYEDRRKGVPTTVAKGEAREWLMEEWQRRWDMGTKGEWTRTLIPKVREWMERAQGETEYHLTQILSGHGCFAEYLCRIGKLRSGECRWCEGSALDTAKHTLLECWAWGEQRGRLRETLGGSIDVKTLGKKIVESEMSWDALAKFARDVLIRKKASLEEEDRQQRQG